MNDNLKKKLFIKIDNSEIIFIAAEIDAQDNVKFIYKQVLPTSGLNNYKDYDLEKIINLIKKNILTIEQKTNFTFKDSIIILNNLNISFLNLTGYKKLNGTQISKENITQILNYLKSSVNQFEIDKKILHIFNLNYYLDKKKMNNLPIGLFGDFYSHELSFNLIKKNDYKNLINIFEKCNLKIKKILLESFVKGSLIHNKNPNIETFFHIQLNENYSKIFYVENSAIKYEQKFTFGTEIIIKDISKITSLNQEIVKKFIENNKEIHKVLDNELLEKEYFINKSFRNIKKNLILRIAEARIKELVEYLIYNNVNFKKSLADVKIIFLEIADIQQLECFKDTYIKLFSQKKKFEINILKDQNDAEMIETAHNIVQFGWKKEAIPVVSKPKSLISRIFQHIFH
tara:strand:+ start:323 stop:1522 length:1200 start_codon:yes stop_codon:yes gene_type:complete